MTDVQQRAAAKHFAEYWKGKGYEKGESQKFWLSLLSEVFGVEHAAEYISFEDQVHLDHTSFIDGFIPATHVLIEQKSLGKSLTSPIQQSDGSLLSPLQQAQRYVHALLDEKGRQAVPRWVITCNFEEFRVYDLDHPQNEAQVVKLEDLPNEYYRLKFLVNTGDEHLKREMELSLKAGELVGKIHDRFLEKYHDPMAVHTQRSLNILCVRLVFCLYAEDAELFGAKDAFSKYIAQYEPKDIRRALIDLFKVLDTPYDERPDLYLSDELAAFPYVNGGLFKDQNIVIPQITDSLKTILVESSRFDWSKISPTIFGALFESTLNQETRRKGGMHYTSIENIHKVIDPLFLNDLRNELESIKALPVERIREQHLRAFQEKLSSLCFLDPAAGSGNFLTESYLCLRKLENEVILLLRHGQISMGLVNNPIKVSITQFFGIEINDFAATVAKTALWIAESQMMKQTEDIVHMPLEFLPLKSYVNIVEGNALRLDWNGVVPARKLSYIIGNPPFVGKKEQSAEQKKELIDTYGKGINGVGNMDYVTGWYVKAAEYMKGTNIRAAFVSTNSITQGEQPPVLWTKLTQLQVNIIFAYRTFVWNSEANEKAHVHCVIIGFVVGLYSQKKYIFDDTMYSEAKSINPYLVDAPTVLIASRSSPLCNVPSMCYGSMPIDNNNLILDEAAVNELLHEDPGNAQFIREYVGGDELLKGNKRWCLWLDGIDPTLYMKSSFIMDRIEANRQYRLYGSTRPQTNKAAETPQLFGEIRQPQNGALVIPKVSSEDRYYIPISYVKPGIIINGSALMIPDADLYYFGILSSNVHNAWMRTIAGRMKSDYQYSAGIVYNNFPWPNVDNIQREEIANAAQAILDAREQITGTNLANMYKRKNFILFGGLKRAHDNLNRFVMRAYGMSIKDTTESSCVAELMKLYQYLTEKK